MWLCDSWIPNFRMFQIFKYWICNTLSLQFAVVKTKILSTLNCRKNKKNFFLEKTNVKSYKLGLIAYWQLINCVLTTEKLIRASISVCFLQEMYSQKFEFWRRFGKFLPL